MSGSLRFSLREHKCFSAYNPDTIFSKPTDTILRMGSTVSAIGRGYIFIVVSRTLLNGKYVRLHWAGQVVSGTKNFAQVLIMDGSYDRSSDTDFPSGSDMLTKGNGLLQTLRSKADVNWDETIDVLVDVSGGTEENCTIFIILNDHWDKSSQWVQTDWFEVNEGAGGSGTLFDEQFTDEVHMEVTGTYGDYGYISEGVFIKYYIVGVTRDADGNPLGSCTVWLFRTLDKSFVEEKTSGGDGSYSFLVLDDVTEYFIRAYKDGVPNVFGTTDRDLKGVEE